MPPAAVSPELVHPIIVAWLAVLGAVFGSFFNVVIHRLPAGESLSSPVSHCPMCKKPIRWYDNVPVISWIVLRGRCRDCRGPISVRYPLVEAAGAVLFGVLGWRELLCGGSNLPRRVIESADGNWLAAPSTWQLGAVYAYHLLLLCTLLCAALIEFDGKRLPLRLFAPAWIVGLLAPMAFPFLLPVPTWPGHHGTLAALTGGVLGWAAGTILGLAVWRLRPNQRQIGTILAPGCVGLTLGWQAAVVLGLVMGALELAMILPGRAAPKLRRIPPITWLAPATFAWIIAWAPLVR